MITDEEFFEDFDLDEFDDFIDYGEAEINLDELDDVTEDSPTESVIEDDPDYIYNLPPTPDYVPKPTISVWAVDRSHPAWCAELEPGQFKIVSIPIEIHPRTSAIIAEKQILVGRLCPNCTYQFNGKVYPATWISKGGFSDAHLCKCPSCTSQAEGGIYWTDGRGIELMTSFWKSEQKAAGKRRNSDRNCNRRRHDSGNQSFSRGFGTRSQRRVQSEDLDRFDA